VVDSRPCRHCSTHVNIFFGGGPPVATDAPDEGLKKSWLCEFGPSTFRPNPSKIHAAYPSGPAPWPQGQPHDEEAPSTSRHWGLPIPLQPSLRSGLRPNGRKKESKRQRVKGSKGQRAKASTFPLIHPSSSERKSRIDARICSDRQRHCRR